MRCLTLTSQAGVSSESSLPKLRTAAEHRPKRQLWATAFTPAALESYQVSLSQRCDELVRLLVQRREVDLYDFFSRASCSTAHADRTGFAFDFVSNFSFSAHATLMANGDLTALLPALR